MPHFFTKKKKPQPKNLRDDNKNDDLPDKYGELEIASKKDTRNKLTSQENGSVDI